jgi:hypothetical protein
MIDDFALRVGSMCYDAGTVPATFTCSGHFNLLSSGKIINRYAHDIGILGPIDW